MITIKAHRTIFVDVDDTLVLWNWQEFAPNGNGTITITDPNDSVCVTLLPHQRHITMMEQFKARGHSIVVWSQGGWAWAESVVKALGIEHLVDVVVDKPSWYIDDLPASAYMGNPIYLHPTDEDLDKRGFFFPGEDKE